MLDVVEDLYSLADRMRRDAQWAARTLSTQDYLQRLAEDVEDLALRLKVKVKGASSDRGGAKEGPDTEPEGAGR